MIKLNAFEQAAQRQAAGDISPASVKPARSTINAARSFVSTLSANPGYSPDSAVK